MYLHQLEKDEKVHFLALAHHLARLDDALIDQRERYLLQYMGAEMGLPEGTTPPAFELPAFLLVFNRPLARRVAVLEAVGVCYASTPQIHPRQQAVLEQLVQAFGLGSAFVEQARGIIARQIAVMDDFDKLINAG